MSLSSVRIAWHNISIVDPLFSGPLLLCVVLGAVRASPRWGRVALLWAVAYLGAGVVQRERAESVGHELARPRGQAPERVEAKPSFGNLLLWKTIYEADGHYHIDAVRIGTTTRIFAGETVAKLDLDRDFPWLDPDSQQARDIERFRWFSAGYLAKSKTRDNFVVDMRYSMLPNRGDGLWGIQLSPDAGPAAHVGYHWTRNTDEPTRRAFLAMVLDTAAPAATAARCDPGAAAARGGAACR